MSFLLKHTFIIALGWLLKFHAQSACTFVIKLILSCLGVGAELFSDMFMPWRYYCSCNFWLKDLLKCCQSSFAAGQSNDSVNAWILSCNNFRLVIKPGTYICIILYKSEQWFHYTTVCNIISHLGAITWKHYYLYVSCPHKHAVLLDLFFASGKT